MQKLSQKYEKFAAIALLGVMIISLIPMAALGFYNHPLGDDFFYGYKVASVLRETGNLYDAIKVACEGVYEYYFLWQGTYSAMFLMHLPPYVFGELFQKIYPSVLIICFVCSTFYLLYSLLCRIVQASRQQWVIISSLVVLVMTQQVPLCGESLYWYNGSMYYTGFLAATFFFFGYLVKGLKAPTVFRVIFLCALGLFLAGGNYISLLPTMIILTLLLLYYVYRNFHKEKVSKQIIVVGLILFFVFLGFSISALAPGNAVRAATSLQLSPIMAIVRSVYQNTRYYVYWNGIWSLLILLMLTPVFWNIAKNTKFKFKNPVIACVLIYSIYCSTSCPPFYAQANGGAARVFCLVYYLMILSMVIIYFYAIGGFYQFINKSKNDKLAQLSDSYKVLYIQAFLIIIFVFLLFVRTWKESYVKPQGIVAFEALISQDAAYYEKQYQERLNLLKDPSVRDVVFPPYDVPESLENLLHLGDASIDPDNLVNRRMSIVYGKDSIRVDNK